MGLVMDGDRVQVLTDIAGEEDHYGDMDFKVAGTREGITALQMDIKVGGLTPEIMAQALEQARVGRLHILDRMLEALAQPRTDISPYAPRILTIRVPVDKIRDIIGPGGKMIRSIVERTGCKIDVEDDGRVSIASVDESAARKAIAIIEELTATPELNKTYLGKVVRVVEFGAFVEILPGTDGLLHVSEMAHHRVQNVRDEVKEGDQVLVKVVSIDPSGKIRLSRKALLEEAQGGAGGDGGSGDGEQPQGGEGVAAGAGAGHSHERPHGGGHDRPARRRAPAGRQRARPSRRRRARPRAGRRRAPSRPRPVAHEPYLLRSGHGRSGSGRGRLVGVLAGGAAAAGPTVEIRASRGGFQPSSVTIRKGETTHVVLTSADGEHCFAIDELRVEKRIVPGRPTRFDLPPDRPAPSPSTAASRAGPRPRRSAAS